MNVIVDLNDIQDKLDLHIRFAEALKLKEYYGKNLDALFDMLTEPHEMWNITFTNCSYAALVIGEYMDLFKAVFEDAKNFGAAVEVNWIDELCCGGCC